MVREDSGEDLPLIFTASVSAPPSMNPCRRRHSTRDIVSGVAVDGLGEGSADDPIVTAPPRLRCWEAADEAVVARSAGHVFNGDDLPRQLPCHSSG